MIVLSVGHEEIDNYLWHQNQTGLCLERHSVLRKELFAAKVQDDDDSRLSQLQIRPQCCNAV